MLSPDQNVDETSNMPSIQMAIGTERAMMIHPTGSYGLFVSGGGNIDAKVSNGWLFLASDRNRLARVVDLYELRDGVPTRVGEPVSDYNAPEPAKRGPGRPRKAER